jgi:4'-phosphopantetheinyl transferase
MSPLMAATAPIADLIRAVALPHDFPGGIDLWLVDLDRYASAVTIDGLQADELARAQAFHFARDRSRFMAGRHALRGLLAAALGELPGDLRLIADRFGKPRLEHGAERLQFNLSHSGPVAIMALSTSVPVGVDIELLKPVADADALAERHFTFDERQLLAAASVTARDRAFLQCWTRKEACLKALGIGLTIDSRDVHAGCDTDFRNVSIAVGPRALETLVWSVGIESIPDTIAAVAVVPVAVQGSGDLWSTAA